MDLFRHIQQLVFTDATLLSSRSLLRRIERAIKSERTPKNTHSHEMTCKLTVGVFRFMVVFVRIAPLSLCEDFGQHTPNVWRNSLQKVTHYKSFLLSSRFFLSVTFTILTSNLLNTWLIIAYSTKLTEELIRERRLKVFPNTLFRPQRRGAKPASSTGKFDSLLLNQKKTGKSKKNQLNVPNISSKVFRSVD